MKRPISTFGLTIFSVLACLGPLFAWQEDESDADLLVTENTWQGRQHFEVYRRIPQRAAKPDQEVLSRVRVEWRGVELKPEWHGLGIRGRLIADDGGEGRPVDWFQGVRVLLIVEREVRVEWPGQLGPDNSSCADALLDADGTFTAYFSLFDAPRAAGMKRSCLAAAVLGKPKGRTITYDDRAPPVAGSVTRLTLPPGPSLDRALQSINAASPWPSRCPEPAAIIRAVNALRLLGKREALDALRRYVEIAPDRSNSHREFFDAASIDQGDRNIAFWIVRLLFEPAQAGMRIREPGLGAAEPHPNKNDMKLWPLFPIELVDDVPFMIAEGWFLAGRPEHPLSYIELAERYGVLRDAPLRPADDPLAAADRLVSLPKSRRLKLREGHIRTQAWQFVADVFPKSKPAPEQIHQISPEQWDELRKAAADGEIRWSERDEAFVLGKPHG